MEMAATDGRSQRGRLTFSIGSWVAVHWELVALLEILTVAGAFRLWSLEGIEPNVLPDEADHLTLMYQIMAGHGPGPFGLSWDGNPAFSLYPSLLFVWLFGGGPIALRVSVALASVLMLGAFFFVARRHCSSTAALAATGLLAFSQWALFFSRNGEVNMFVALYAMLGAWSLQRALGGEARWPWALAGFWAGMGWYGFLAGIFILPSLLVPVAWWIVRRREQRAALLRGVALMLAMFALTVAPRVPILIAQWQQVQTYVDGRSALRDVPLAEMPRVLAGQAETTVRAFVLLDPTLEGNQRYMARGRAPLDAFNGTLFVAGLVVGAWALLRTALWFSLLVVPIAATQLTTVGIPDLARAIAALPAIFLFVGLAIDWAVRRMGGGPLAYALLLVAVPTVCLANWQAYVTWMATPEAAQVRQPALEYDELAGWQTEQRRRASLGERGLTVNQWRDLHPRSVQPPPGVQGRLRSIYRVSSRPPGRRGRWSEGRRADRIPTASHTSGSGAAQRTSGGRCYPRGIEAAGV